MPDDEELRERLAETLLPWMPYPADSSARKAADALLPVVERYAAERAAEALLAAADGKGMASTQYGRTVPVAWLRDRADAREQIAEWLRANLFWGLDPGRKYEAADRLVAECPAVAEGLAAREAVEQVRALTEELQTLEASRAECRSNLVDALRDKDRLGDAITDLCWKATPFGGGDDVTAYLLPAGTVHRLIGAAQGVGIPAAFRALDGEPEGHSE